VTGKLVTVHAPNRLIHCYCNIQECVTGKYYNNNTLLHKVHGPLLTYQSRIPVYYNNNTLLRKVHGQLLTYQSRIPVYYVHGPYGVMYYYCNIQECVTGKSVTVHGSYGVMYCHTSHTLLYITITIHYSIRSMDSY
jgi:hypothetical protein